MSSLSNRLTKEAIAIYRTRMKIEQSFRDLKSHRFGFSFSSSGTRDKERLNILLLIAMLATLSLWHLGKSMEHLRGIKFPKAAEFAVVLSILNTIVKSYGVQTT